jgi:hypothetical protein
MSRRVYLTDEEQKQIDEEEKKAYIEERKKIVREQAREKASHADDTLTGGVVDVGRSVFNTGKKLLKKLGQVKL